jgi:L-threonylcarbamoyladenylate synthase
VTRSDLELASEAVRRGGVVAVATDTLVGLLALAEDAEAVRRVLAIKGPGRQSPIPVLLPDIGFVPRVVASFPDDARERAERSWPGPLTVVLRAREGLPAELLAGGSTVGVRVPGPSPALDLVRAVGVPLTGSSANRSGQPAVASTADLDPEVARAVDLVWPSRAAIGKASTVVDFTVSPPLVLRP